MAVFPISIFFEVVFLFMGIYLMDGGKFFRFIAIWVFITEIPIVSSSQIYITENAGTISSVSMFFPLVLSSTVITFFIVMSYAAVVNLFFFMGRDFVGRKRINPPGA